MKPLVIAFLACWATVAALPAASAPFQRTLRDYTRQRWSEGEIPAPVNAIAQDKRGYLWLATAQGLFRFDGIGFDRIGAGVTPFIHGAPSVLLVRKNGDVWTNFERSRRFAIYRQGRLYWAPGPVSPARVTRMAEAPDGSLWAMTDSVEEPLMRLEGHRWVRYRVPPGRPDNPTSMVVAADGTVWLAMGRSVLRVVPGDDRLRTFRQTPDGLGALSLDPRGRVWLTERRGSYPLTGVDGRGAPPVPRFPYATERAKVRGQPSFDREGNLWIASYYGGIERVAKADPGGATSFAEARSRVERLAARDGLSSDATRQVLQDLEGNIWIATEKGIDRFWPAAIREPRGLSSPAAFGDLLMRASDGSVFIGQSMTVYRVTPGGMPESILRSTIEPSTICEAPDRSIWITLDTDVVRWSRGRVSRRIPAVPTTTTLYDCAFDREGTYWISSGRGGLFRYTGGKWRAVKPTGGASFVPRSMAVAKGGNIVVHWDADTLRWASGRSAALPIPNKSHPHDEITLYPSMSGSLFVATRLGLSRFDGRRFASIPAQAAPILAGINGMVQTAEGESWLAGPAGILRMRTLALDRALSGHRGQAEVQILNGADGLKSLPHTHSRRSLVEGGDGRIWISSQTGTLWLDPRDLGRSLAAPRLAISALIADRTYRDPGHVRLPAGTRDIELAFSVIKFSSPRELRVRYRLRGQNDKWVDAGIRRQAFFTNLAPGEYQFQVIAANRDGVWNRRGATVTFEIPPTFVQSPWFILLCGLAAVAIGWIAVAIRTRQISRQLQSRMAERMAERERIARDLHDTLLQSVQGLILSFQALAERLTNRDREQLEVVLKRADGVIVEARESVLALRRPEHRGDLSELFLTLSKEAGFPPSIHVEISVEGRVRGIHPAVSAEISSIVGEALFNIARHARATKVEVAAKFERRQLLVRVRDDGIGIEPAIVRDGRASHMGLATMRERAKKAGGRLNIDSAVGRGTDVIVEFPARVAFASGKRSVLGLVRSFTRWNTHPGKS
jgi:signal transduction histidine kinase/ligand-binding sensor domain-containing protein